MAEITVLLRQWRRGDGAALDQLMPIVYGEVHRLAEIHLRRERNCLTFSPTDVVSEAMMRLIFGEQPDWTDRAHFFAIVARNMRRVLVEHARRRGAGKRGSGRRTDELDVPILEKVAADERPPAVVALDDALKELARFDERAARTIELRYFGGMSHKEIGAVLGVHENTVLRQMRLGEAWLKRRLAQQ